MLAPKGIEFILRFFLYKTSSSSTRVHVALVLTLNVDHVSVRRSLNTDCFTPLQRRAFVWFQSSLFFDPRRPRRIFNTPHIPWLLTAALIPRGLNLIRLREIPMEIPLSSLLRVTILVLQIVTETARFTRSRRFWTRRGVPRAL